MPRSERELIEQKEEIYNFLAQSNISEQNITRLNHLIESPNEEVAYFASIVLEVAKIKPHKKKRLKVLARERRDLLEKLDESGLIFAHGGY